MSRAVSLFEPFRISQPTYREADGHTGYYHAEAGQCTVAANYVVAEFDRRTGSSLRQLSPETKARLATNIIRHQAT